MNEKKLTKRVINDKSVHITMPGTVHRQLRAFLFLKEISMQEFFKTIAEKTVLKDNYLEKIIDERVKEIKEKKLNNLRNIDEKDLYDAIEKNSPFKK